MVTSPKKNYHSVIIKILCILFLLRITSDLPVAFKQVGWVTYTFPISLTKVFTFVLIGYQILLVSLALKRVSRRIFNNLFVLVIFLMFSTALSIISFSEVGMQVTGTINVLFRYLMEIILFLFTYKYINKETDLIIIKNYLLIPLIYIIITTSFFQILTDSYYNIQGVDRLVGPFSNPNVLAPFINLCIFLAIIYLRKKLISKSTYILLGLLFFLLFVTGSLTSIIGLVIFVFILFMYLKLYKNKIFYVSAPLIIVSLVLFISKNWESIIHRISIVFNPSTFELSSASSVSWRIMAWSHYLDLIENIPQLIFGFGIGFQRFIFLNGIEGNLSYIFEAPGTHNDYLAILIDFGLLGFIFFIYFLILLFNSINNYLNDRGLIYIIKAFIFSYIIIMIMDNYLDGLITWVFFFFLFSIINVNRSKRYSNEK